MSRAPAKPASYTCIILHGADELTHISHVGEVNRHYLGTAPSSIRPLVHTCAHTAAALMHLCALMQADVAGDAPVGWNDDAERLGAAWVRAAVLNVDPVLAGMPLSADAHLHARELPPVASMLHAMLMARPPASEAAPTTVSTALDAKLRAYMTPTVFAAASKDVVRGWAWATRAAPEIIPRDLATIRLGETLVSELYRLCVPLDGCVWFRHACTCRADAEGSDGLDRALEQVRALAGLGPQTSTRCACEYGRPHVDDPPATALPTGSRQLDDAVWGNLSRVLPLRHVPAALCDGAALAFTTCAQELHRKNASTMRHPVRRECTAEPVPLCCTPATLPFAGTPSSRTSMTGGPATPGLTDSTLRNQVVERVLRANASLAADLRWSTL